MAAGVPWAPAPRVLLCEPIYLPDPAMKTGGNTLAPFMLWDSLARLKMQYPEAFTWESSSWQEFLRKWDLDCTEYHIHDETPTPESTAPSTPSTLTPSPPPSPPITPSPLPPPVSPTKPSLREHQKMRNDVHYQSLVDSGDLTLDDLANLEGFANMRQKKSNEDHSVDDGGKLTKDDLAHLAGFVHTRASPVRLRQQFARTLGPHAVLHDPPAEITPIPVRNADAPPPSAPCTLTDEDRYKVNAALCAGAEFIQGDENLVLVWPERHSTTPKPVAEQLSGSVSPSTSRLLYAVSGRNIVFRSRDRAVAALKSIPSAELLCTDDEEEAVAFLAAELEANVRV
ncbi:hypothetical protein B0H12DRAFT_1070632 [Mycena haematopus]|nr:hypothetical protein B0H12DRAFT_1070632 [Mycena haematopus]